MKRILAGLIISAVIISGCHPTPAPQNDCPPVPQKEGPAVPVAVDSVHKPVLADYVRPLERNDWGVVASLVLTYDAFFDALEAERNILKTAKEREPAREPYAAHLEKVFSGYKTPGRFIFTRTGGFIDIMHLLGARRGARQPGVTPQLALMIGEGIEYDQASKAMPSAWSIEDLPSNAAGVGFVSAESDADTARAFIDDLKAYFDDQLGGPAPIPDAMDAFRVICNFGYTPLIDLDAADIRVSDDGIRYLSSGSDSMDAQRLDGLRSGFGSAPDKK